MNFRLQHTWYYLVHNFDNEVCSSNKTIYTDFENLHTATMGTTYERQLLMESITNETCAENCG